MSESPGPGRDQSELAIRPMRADAGDVRAFLDCFASNSSPRSRELVEWQYLANPTGKLLVDFAIGADSRLAAIYASLPVRIRLGGKVELAIQSVDTITDEAFRGRGLFLRLAQRTYARAAEGGAKLVYGFPNGNSAHGFFNRLDWTNLDPLPFLIRPLRTTYVLERLKLGGLAKSLPQLPLLRRSAKPYGEPITRFDERASQLWHEFAHSIGVAVERDANYLNWRLVQKPGEAYVTIGVFVGDRLVALLSYAVKDKHGGRIGYIMESLCAPGHERDLRGLMSTALTNMLDAGADVVLAWCFSHSPTYRTFLRTGFLPFPTRMRPIELHVGARSFTTDAAVARDRRSWYLSYLDADTT